MNTKLVIGTVAATAVIAPTALLAAALAVASPYDPTTTTVIPTPTYTQTQQAPAYTPTQTVPAYTPTQQAPAYTPTPVDTPPVQQAPAYTPTVEQTPVYTPPPRYTPTQTVEQTQTPVYTPTRNAPVTTPEQTAVVTTSEPTRVVVQTTPTTPVSTPSAVTTSASPPSSAVTSSSSPVTTSASGPPSDAERSTPGSSAVTTSQSSQAQVSTSAPVTTTSKPPVVTTNVSGVASPVLVVPEPPSAQAPPSAVAAAKVAPAAVIDIAQPPPPPPNVTVNFNTEINVAVHNEVNITNVTEFRPRHWDYIDYDQYRRPCFYNPIDVGLSYRYYYDGDYREVWVPAGGRIVLNVAIGGVFPFTAVGLGGYVYTGSFYGGAWVPPDGWYGPPPDYWQPYQPTVYNNMSVYVPAVQRTVVVNRVTVVGHDDSRPFGQQDSFMLDDNRLAWGQVADGKDGGRIEVTKSQATPGVGPVDDGGPIVKTTLAAAEKPMGTNYTPWILGGVILVGAGGIGWVIKHPKSTR